MIEKRPELWCQGKGVSCMKRFLLVLFLVAYAASAGAAGYAQIDSLWCGLRDSVGDALAGGKVYFYKAGTTATATVYSDPGLTPLSNPVILDSNGRALVFTNSALRIVVHTATDVPVLDYDELAYGVAATGLNGTRIVDSFTSTSGQTTFLLSTSAAGAEIDCYIDGCRQASGTFTWTPPLVIFSTGMPLASMSVEFVTRIP
jgi:hypothetical protein